MNRARVMKSATPWSMANFYVYHFIEGDWRFVSAYWQRKDAMSAAIEWENKGKMHLVYETPP